MEAGEFVQAGRLFEANHRLDDAVEAYVRGEAFNDAARVLSHQGLFREAGEVLLFYLPRDPTPVDRLKPEARRHAMNAALCFARGGARREAVGLLMNLGEHQKAASLLSMAGMRQEAVQAMRGQPVDGSPWPVGVVFPLRAAPPRGRGLRRAGGAPAVAPPPPARGSIETDPISDASLPPFEPAPAPPSLARRASHPGRRVGEPGSRTPSFATPQVSRRSSPGLPRVARRVSQPGVLASEASLRRDPGLERRSSDARLPRPPSVTLTGDGHESSALAVQAILQARWHQNPLSPRMVQFLDSFLEDGLRQGVGEDDRATCYAVGRLFEFHDRMGPARKAYSLAAGLADSAERLERLEQGLVQTREGRWLPLHLVVDGKAHQFADLPSLDSLPALGPSLADDAVDFDKFMTPGLDTGSTSGGLGSSVSGLWTGNLSDRSLSSASDSVHGPIGEGSLVADRYRIEALIGQGGMGTVYEAVDMELDETVALKVFQQVVQNKPGLERFRREMKLSRKLIHPNIVRIYEFGTWRGARYITMELLSGKDLEEYTESRGGTLESAQALSLLMQACDGLTAAHKQGVVHRDIKPQNLFVVDGGKRLKIMDFGIAKVSNSTSISITGVRVGTPRYMSPEQIQGGGTVGPAADLYALGGVMYELFTGSPVFEEEELVPLLLNHMTEEPVPPSVRNPEVSAEVEHIILRLLQKNPEDRYRDASELKRELLSAYVQAERLHRS